MTDHFFRLFLEKFKYLKLEHSVQRGLYPSLYGYSPFLQNVPTPKKIAVFENLSQDEFCFYNGKSYPLISSIYKYLKYGKAYW